MDEASKWPLFHLLRALFCGRWPHRPDERLDETNNTAMSGEPRQRKLGSTDADDKWQLGPPAAANDEKTRTHRRGLQAACTDGCPRRTVQFQHCRPRFSTTPTRRKRKQWKPIGGSV